MAFSVGPFLFHKRTYILCPGSVWDKCDLAKGMEVELPRHNDYTLQQVIYYRIGFCQWLT